MEIGGVLFHQLHLKERERVRVGCRSIWICVYIYIIYILYIYIIYIDCVGM